MKFKKIKLIFYIIAGGVGGALFTILFFIHESSISREIPAWGIALSVITALIGAVISGFHYYDEIYENKESSRDENT